MEGHAMQIKVILANATILTIIFAFICIILPLSAYAASPVASFTASPASGSAPLDVSFTDTSSNSPTGWSWAFGDGSFSSSRNPAHTYTAAGTYTVRLSVSNADGSDTTTRTITVSPGAASRLTIVPLSSVLTVDGNVILPDDGTAGLPVVAVLADQYGNPISGASVTLMNRTNTAYVFTTDNLGVAGPVILGPWTARATETATATFPSLPPATYSVNFVDVIFNAVVSDSVVTAGDSVTATATIKIDDKYYDGIPVKFRLYHKPGNLVDESIVNTVSGTASKVEWTMNETGVNMIVVSVDELGKRKGLTVQGVNGIPARILVSTSVMGSAEPVSGNAFADGFSHYLVVAQVVDSKGNPIADGANITFTDDDGHIWNKTTNEFGKASIETYASNYVRDSLIQISSTNCSKGITLSYVAGPPTRVFVRAVPNVVASSDIDGTGMAADPHVTNISAMVTDAWYHPISGKTVAFSTSGIASISPVTAVTDSTGTATAVFTLNWKYANGTWDKNAAPVPKVAPYYGTTFVKAQYSEAISATANIIYTNDSFLCVDSAVTPVNATLGKPINVSVNITGIGWQVKAKPNDIFLVMDSSSSMDWFADVVQDNTFVPNSAYTASVVNGIATGSIPKGNIPSDNSTAYKNNNSWYYVGSYYYDNTSGVKSFDIMFSWNWENYLHGTGGGTGTGNTYYLMKVLGPNKVAYEPDDVRTPGYSHKTISPGYGLTECIWVNHDASSMPSGRYDIYGYYCEGSVARPSPYRLSVETNTHRFQAAKDACSAFITNVAADDRVGFVPYGESVNDGQVIPLTPMNLSADRNTTSAKIQSQAIIGGTNTYKGLQKALDRFNSSSTDPNVKRVIVLVTDGYSYRPDLDKNEAAIARGMGVTIFTVGIGACDEITLKKLANDTGGEYYHAVNQSDLINQFINITQYIHDVVATDSQISLISNRTQVNGTWTNSTHYINGTAYKKTPTNPAWASTEPDEPIIANTTHGYSLTWHPGEIHIAQTWSLKYQLMVDAAGPDGVIEPISNESYIWFERGSNATGDYQSFVVKLAGNTVHVTANGTPAEEKLNVTLRYPERNKNVNDTVIKVRWEVNYTALEYYNQTLYYSYENGPFIKIADLAGWNNSSNPRVFEYSWDVSDTNKYPPGNYTQKVEAYDTIYSGSDTVPYYRPDMSGKIILR